MNELKNNEKVIKTKPEIILMDLGKVLLYSKEELPGKMNPRHRELLQQQGENYLFFEHFGINENLFWSYWVL